ncbi:UNVERIFIED_CONTAM: hypothetical protein GTU68_007581, partial [Idotea baltica]|nr:hypothetical protein [Idotea baltica]
VKYVSTRGTADVLGFEDAVLAGLARDGGLYVPQAWPEFSDEEIAAMAGQPYDEVAARVLLPFTGGAMDHDGLRALVVEAYAGFAHRGIVPLVQMDHQNWLMELFHGPTLAFKDLAMQVIGLLFEEILTKRDQRVTIVGATSGDTGSAAMEAFRGRERADVFILYPHGRVSEVQRRQMTTPSEPNVHAIAVEGDFDACQAHVKAMFNDHTFRDSMNLGAVNSINWARILGQVVYYATTSVALCSVGPVNYSVPTGNFGDIFAGYVAKQMGFPVGRLMVATNENDILHRTFETGRYEKGMTTPTISPSMDIQVSSNFERLVFELVERDGAAVTGMMDDLAKTGAFSLSQGHIERLREDFDSARVDQARTKATIAKVLEDTGILLDPHTAIGVAAAQGWEVDGPIVSLACAHPAKFPDAVKEAAGEIAELPPHMADLYERDERVTVLPNDLAAIQAHIRNEARV